MPSARVLLERIEALEAAVDKLTAELRTVKAAATRANRVAKAAADSVDQPAAE